MKSGVYAIINNSSGDCYVGSSCDINKRFKSHIYDLKRGKHHSWELQRAVDILGIDSFSFRVLEFCACDLLMSTEQKYIDSLKPIYNITRVAGYIPITHENPSTDNGSQLSLW